jgi:hypothetical protein
MLIEFNGAELDCVYRALMARPMGEVEPVVLNLRSQVARHQQGAAEGPEGAAKRREGAGEGDDSLPLP